MDNYSHKRNQGLIMHGLLVGELDPAYEQYIHSIREQRAIAQERSQEQGLLEYATDRLGFEIPDLERDALIYAVRPMRVNDLKVRTQLAENLLFQATIMSRQGESLWPQAYDAALLKWAAIALPEHIGVLEDFMRQEIGLAQTAYTAAWSKFYHAPPSDELLETNRSVRSVLDSAANGFFKNDYMTQSQEHAAIGIEAFIAASVLDSSSIIKIASSHDIKNHLLVRQARLELEGIQKNWILYHGRAKETLDHILLILKNDYSMKN